MANSSKEKDSTGRAGQAGGTQKKSASAKPAKRDYPLRSKRRLQTRTALIQAALKLMSERGFDNVTMQEVADAAGTHAQTLYSHFPNKYALSAAAAVVSFSTALAARKTDTMTFWREWVEARTKEASGAEKEFAGLVSDTLNKSRFALVNLAVSQEYIDVLAEGLAEDFELDASSDLLPKLIAQMLMAASQHSIFAWQESRSEYDLLKGQLDGVDEVAGIVALICKARGIVRNS